MSNSKRMTIEQGVGDDEYTGNDRSRLSGSRSDLPTGDKDAKCDVSNGSTAV